MDKIIDYPIVSLEKHIGLIADLIRSVDDFILCIAPEGYNSSPYAIYYKPSPDLEYESYRYRRARQYKIARQEGSPFEVTSLMSLEEWTAKEYKPTPALIPDEPLALLITVFVQMYFAGFIFDRNFGRYDFRIEKEELYFIVEQSLKTSDLKLSADFKLENYLDNPFQYLEELDREKIHHFVFGFLLARGLEFYYESEYLKFILRLGRELETKEGEEDMGKNEAIANFLQLNEVNEENPGGAYPDFSAAFQKVAKSDPEEILLTYKEVYKVWPEGYPPVVSDYI